MLGRLVPAALVASVFAPAAGGAPAAVGYTDRIAGVEVPPITSTLGTFVGGAVGSLPGRWRVQIAHRPLRAGSTVAITGGSFTMRPLERATLTASVTGGSVTLVSAGERCTDQAYAVDANLTLGTFTGTLVHHRRTFLGRCVVYAATISGRATLTA
jgi:hypothetical protein